MKPTPVSLRAKEQFEQMMGHPLCGHPLFYELLLRMADVHSRKNHDYAGEDRPLRNLTACERMGIDPFVGCVFRLQDKWSRLEQFVKTGHLAVADEPIEDTLIDNANYSLLALILRREGRNGEA